MLSSTLMMNASLGRLSPKVENGNEVWAVPKTPSPSNITVASHSKEDVTPRIVVSVINCMETSPEDGSGHVDDREFYRARNSSARSQTCTRRSFRNC